jgi:hypothetical protein
LILDVATRVIRWRNFFGVFCFGQYFWKSQKYIEILGYSFKQCIILWAKKLLPAEAAEGGEAFFFWGGGSSTSFSTPPPPRPSAEFYNIQRPSAKQLNAECGRPPRVSLGPKSGFHLYNSGPNSRWWENGVITPG